MILQTKYQGRSAVIHGLDHGMVVLATNQQRTPAYFHGQVRHAVMFREAMATFLGIMQGDFRYHPKDKQQFLAWLEEQDRKFLMSLTLSKKSDRAKFEEIDNRLYELQKSRRQAEKPFESARHRYLKYLLVKHEENHATIDPIVTVHPDEMSFEGFSKDESTYVRVALNFDLFQNVNEFGCGTTNIHLQHRLFGEVERIRSYRPIDFSIRTNGISLAGENSATSVESQQEIPESWIMGFLQVQSCMALSLTRFHMAPIDLHNICRTLRRRKAKTSPRALRYEFVPGEPTKAVIEPWNTEIPMTSASPVIGGKPLSLELTPGAIYQGSKPIAIRTWGRDRLQSTIRLLPYCRRIDVFLAGNGMPSFYVFDLGPITVTVGLSGWTDNDWTDSSNRFELLSRHRTVTSEQLTDVDDALRVEQYATDGALATTTGYTLDVTRSALSHLCQEGRAMFDLAHHFYRHRELFPTTFDSTQALTALAKTRQKTSPQEESAQKIFSAGNVFISSRKPMSFGMQWTGSIKGSDQQRRRAKIDFDHDGQVRKAECSCSYYRKHQLTKGPCEHILALRLAFIKYMKET